MSSPRWTSGQRTWHAPAVGAERPDTLSRVSHGSLTGTVTLVRHAETEWSRRGVHCGRTDVALTAAGRVRAVALRARLERRSFDRVLTSPLSRAAETARLAGFSGAERDRDLREWDYGEHEGLSTPEIRERLGPEWLIWFDGAEDGEAVSDVGARVDRVIERVTSEAGAALIFAHGDVLRVLAARWLEQPAVFGARLILGPAAICLLGYEREVRSIVSWNVPDPTQAQQRTV